VYNNEAVLSLMSLGGMVYFLKMQFTKLVSKIYVITFLCLERYIIILFLFSHLFLYLACYSLYVKKIMLFLKCAQLYIQITKPSSTKEKDNITDFNSHSAQKIL